MAGNPHAYAIAYTMQMQPSPSARESKVTFYALGDNGMAIGICSLPDDIYPTYRTLFT